MSFLSYLEPVMTLLPEVEKPSRKLDVTDRVLWTAMSLMIFLVCSQVPVYGIRPKQEDWLYWMRSILASNKGTLMELGISPLVTASLVMQFLQGAHIVNLNENKSRDRGLMQSATKALGLIIAFITAVGYVLSGAYGDDISMFHAALIVGQLVVSCILCLLLDEMLQKGYGFGSGSTLFIVASVCEGIAWKAFSPFTLNAGRGPEYEGAIVSLFAQLVQSPNKVKALRDAFYRPHLPNVISLLATAVVFIIVTFFQGFGVMVKLQHAASKQSAPQKIRLFYTSNMPIVLHTALVSNMFFISSVLAHRFPKSSIVDLLGKWETMRVPGGSAVRPVSGLLYYASAPHGLAAVAEDPLHAAVYLVFMCASCALFARTWVTISNQTGKDLAKAWYSHGLIQPGHQSSLDNLSGVVGRYVPTAAALGGICIGILTVLADLLGAVGSGTGILLAVTSIHSYAEQLEREKMLPSFLGK